MADSASHTFATRYGPWALVAGASEGLGAALADQAARRGLNVVGLARRREPLERLVESLVQQYRVEGRAIAVDLADADAAGRVIAELGELEAGLLVYNAAASTIGPFLETPVEAHLASVAVNCRTPVTLVHHFGGRMAERGRGGVVLMSSMAGFQGSPLVASYAATKAFTRVLGEGLWEELGRVGVDVLVCSAGATATPGYLASQPRKGSAMAPEAVARRVFESLGRRPETVPGLSNRLAAWVMQRALPRSWAVRIMGRATRERYGER